ncbi:MAG TPA: hypothetical protein VN213_19915, partial [Solirubrobacteraceae bacterium]|nr:hypothetical protein [Solirubrobacteraceae bacterium]
MTPPDPQLYAGLDKDVPIVFLPVRLETRWGPLEEDSNGVEFRALRIRIYPDDIAIDTHDPTLTDAEIAAGRAFWDAHDEPTAGEPERLEAWSALARAVEAQRALHVARATRDRTVEPPRRSGARAEAIARLLPDRWVVTGWVAGGGRYVVEQSEPVRRPLTVGPAQRDDGGAVLDPEDPLLLDPGSRWLADFYEARAAGMALIVNVPAPGGVARLDALYVFGVRVPSADGDPSTEAAELADVLRRQGASVGAGFLPAGTPTNNLNGSRSGWSSVPDLQELYRRLQAPAPAPAPRDRALEGDGTAGEIAVAALGVPSTAVEGFAREGDASARHARAMAQALFPVTWGELIGTLLVPSRVDAERDRPLLDALADVLSFAEEHAVDYVRGRGPLPTLRVGRQPYGILPVTDFTRWRRQDGEPPLLAGLAAQLGRLRPFWDEAASRVPQFPKDRSGRLDEAGRTLAGLLALGPVPHPAGYWITPATGELTTKIYNTQRPLIPGLAADGDLSDEDLKEIALGTRVVVDRHMLSYLWPRGERSRLLRMKPGKPEPLRFPVAQPAKVGDEVLSPSEYLQRLARDSVPDILRVATVDPPRDLLYQLIYRSLVLASEQSALALIRGWLPPEHPWASTILATSPDVAALGLDDGPTPELAMTTPFAKLAEMAQADAPASAIRTLKAAEVATKSELLREARDTIGERLRPLAEQFVRTQAAVLALGAAGGAGLDSAELTRLLGETLATCGTRLDAWLTSIATRRLALLRRARPEGVYVGAYGWLLDLAPDEIPVPEPPDGWAEEGLERFETVMPAEPVGYVHAPSLAQATTAALLRAAELVHGEGGSSLARLDLTSRRVRTAAWILDAVHNGQPLPAVLGYRLERALHDRSDAAVGVNLHRLVDPLRRAYPQRDAPAPDGAPPRDRHVPPEVVDGLAVWEAWRADPGVAERLLRASLPAGVAQPSHATTSALAEVMRELDGAVEAVADLVVAEGVHQLAAGNPVKAGATFDAVAAATPPPADLEVLRTPRTGTTITHRLVLAFDGSDDVPPGWDAARPRAQASSHAEAWAARVLGSPSSWSFVDGHGQPCTLADFGALCALDVVAEATGTATSQPLLARRAPGGAVSGDAWDRLLAVARTLADVLSSA